MFKTRTADSIVSSFTKAVKSLEDHAEAQRKEAFKHSVAIVVATEKKVAAEAEAAKATSYGQKLAALFA